MMNFSKELGSRWITIMCAAVVSEAVPWRKIWESVSAWAMDLPWPGSLVFLIALFAALDALVLLVALGAYLGATRSFSLRGFLIGSLAAFFVLILGNVLVIGLPLPRLFLYYVVWRLPLFISLVLGICVAREITAHVSAKSLLA